MGFNLIITPIAQSHIERALEYYNENANIKTVVAFYDALQDCYASLEQSPYYAVRIKSYRVIPIKKFPYLVFFEILENENIVKILSVFNTYQSETKWP